MMMSHDDTCYYCNAVCARKNFVILSQMTRGYHCIWQLYLCLFLAEMKVVALLVSRRGTKCCCVNSSGSPRANGSSSPAPSVNIIVPTTSNLVPV